MHLYQKSVPAFNANFSCLGTLTLNSIPTTRYFANKSHNETSINDFEENKTTEMAPPQHVAFLLLTGAVDKHDALAKFLAVSCHPHRDIPRVDQEEKARRNSEGSGGGRIGGNKLNWRKPQYGRVTRSTKQVRSDKTREHKEGYSFQKRGKPSRPRKPQSIETLLTDPESSSS